MGDRKQPTPPPVNQVKPDPPPAPPRTTESGVAMDRQEAIDAWRKSDMRFAKASSEMLALPLPIPDQLVREFIEARREYRETSYRCGQLNVFGDQPREGFGEKY